MTGRRRNSNSLSINFSMGSMFRGQILRLRSGWLGQLIVLRLRRESFDGEPLRTVEPLSRIA